MKKSVLSALVAGALLIGTPTAADAARPSRSPDAFTITDQTPVGIDISYPACGAALPKNASFVVVGVNGGLATNTNPCLKDQFAWAAGVTGRDVGVPKRQLYINTANPAAHVARPSKKYPVVGWPDGTEDVGGPGALNGGYGDCDVAVDSTSRACTWLYGYLRAKDSVDHFQATTGESATGYRWWLDVETSNSWLEPKEDRDAYAKNVAAIEGFAAGIKSYGESTYVGVYSNPGSWIPITNTGAAISATSPLRQLDTWRTSSSFYSYDAAKTTCTDYGSYTGLKPGGLVMVQFVASGLDHNVSCVDPQAK